MLRCGKRTPEYDCAVVAHALLFVQLGMGASGDNNGSDGPDAEKAGEGVADGSTTALGEHVAAKVG